MRGRKIMEAALKAAPMFLPSVPCFRRSAYAVNELPQPQPPVAFGFVKENPDPCIEDT